MAIVKANALSAAFLYPLDTMAICIPVSIVFAAKNSYITFNLVVERAVVRSDVALGEPVFATCSHPFHLMKVVSKFVFWKRKLEDTKSK